MSDEPSFCRIWEDVVSAVDARVAEAKREYGIKAQGLQVIPQTRHIVVREPQIGGTVVQANISLQGDSIEIKRQETGGGFVDQEPETIEIEIKNGTVAFIHDDIDRTTDPNKVADLILAPILDRYRA